MGLVNGRLTLRNPRNPQLEVIETLALADSGSTYLCIPERLRAQLQLETADHKDVTLADGASKQVPYVGPIELHFKNRSCFVGALVLGDQVLLGAIPMQDMDLVILPKTHRLDVNPESPHIASGVAKGGVRPA